MYAVTSIMMTVEHINQSQASIINELYLPITALYRQFWEQIVTVQFHHVIFLSTVLLVFSDMENQVRRRRGGSGSGENSQTTSHVTEGSGSHSSKIDSAFTYLVVLVLVAILSCLAVTKLIPDHPVAVAVHTLLDWALTSLGLSLLSKDLP